MEKTHTTKLSLPPRAVTLVTLKQSAGMLRAQRAPRGTDVSPLIVVVPGKAEMRTGVSALPSAKVETLEQVEMRRARVESITRRAPEVVITRRWIHTANHFDAQSAVVLKLPWLQRLRNWLHGE